MYVIHAIIHCIVIARRTRDVIINCRQWDNCFLSLGATCTPPKMGHLLLSSPPHLASILIRWVGSTSDNCNTKHKKLKLWYRTLAMSHGRYEYYVNIQLSFFHDSVTRASWLVRGYYNWSVPGLIEIAIIQQWTCANASCLRAAGGV